MRNLDLLIPKDDKPTERWTWATVTQSDPLRIRLDGETVALDITPENLAGALLPGERVWVQVSGRRVLVTGRTGGMGVPTGSVQMFMGATAPAGWLLLDGSTFDSNVHPALAGLLGTTTLPDMAQRFPLGGDGVAALGALGGSQSIAEANLPAHSHSIDHNHPNATTSSDTHSHSFMFEVQSDAPNSGAYPRVTDIQNAAGNGGVNYNPNTNSDTHSHTVSTPTHNGNSGLTGSGTDYWQPFVVVNFIIKT